MKKVNIAFSALVSIGIGAVSLWIFLVNGWKLISYSHPLDLADLSEQTIKLNRYVKGTISDCFTVPAVEGRDDLRNGSSELLLGFGKDYECYTIPIPEGRYIRVYLCEKESLNGMERIVKGDPAEVSFAGLLVRPVGSLNTEFYDKDPEFDQSRLVTDLVLMQRTTEKEKNLFFLGLFGMVAAALIYMRDGISITGVSPEKKKDAGIPNYNKENEMIIARRRLERYAEQERVYRKMSVIGTGCVIGGLFLILATPALALMGLAFMIYGVKKWWDRFINSENRHAMNIAKLFSLKTLQTKKSEEERKLEEYEKNEQNGRARLNGLSQKPND